MNRSSRFSRALSFVAPPGAADREVLAFLPGASQLIIPFADERSN
jgi:hypothetical protein